MLYSKTSKQKLIVFVFIFQSNESEIWLKENNNLNCGPFLANFQDRRNYLIINLKKIIN